MSYIWTCPRNSHIVTQFYKKIQNIWYLEYSFIYNKYVKRKSLKLIVHCHSISPVHG
jgi:hypothetical protein